ncbi:MAG: cob(I)yrinic acid a,c-diamide adenosyltransferase [Myxococcota bacterium]
MVRLTKIYTRTGDKGTTRLVGGQEVDKDSARIEAYGTVDEVNAVVGLVRTALRREETVPGEPSERLERWLHDVQQALFNLGSDLATYREDRFEGQPVTTEEDITALERTIDEMNADLEPLKSFVLPGGGPVSALLHQARTVCRRAERRTLTLARQEEIGEHVIPYLNRLSDAFFVASRWVSRHGDEPEILWEY